MKASEYRDHTLEELENMVIDAKQDIFNLRFQHATGQLDDISRITKAKRNLARMITILRECELGINQLLGGKKKETS